MDVLKVKLIIFIISFSLITGGLIGGLLYYVFPQFFPNWYFQIVFFFLIIESLLMNFVATKRKSASSKKMVNVYMLCKVVKILTSLVFITIYALVVKENIKSFVLVFVVFYGLYLFFETYLFSKIEKELKEKQQTKI